MPPTYELIKKAIREENPERIKQYHREQMEHNRRLLEDHGAKYNEEEHRIRSMISPEAQLQLFGCHDRTELGTRVARAVAVARPLQQSYFVRSFNYPEAATASRESLIASAATRIHTPYTILPPLLCRSRVTESIGLEGAGNGHFRETRDHTRCSVLIVGQQRGPMILVVRNDALPLLLPYLGALCGALGFLTPKQLVRDCMRRKG